MLMLYVVRSITLNYEMQNTNFIENTPMKNLHSSLVIYNSTTSYIFLSNIVSNKGRPEVL